LIDQERKDLFVSIFNTYPLIYFFRVPENRQSFISNILSYANKDKGENKGEEVKEGEQEEEE